MKTYLTGGTGFVGGALARILREAGHEVTALVRRPDAGADLRSLGCALVPGDITRPDTLAETMAGMDVVFHVAGWYELGKSTTRAERVNVEGTRNVLEAAVEQEVPRIVHTSTLAVHSDTRGKAVDEDYRYVGPFLSAYDRTKWEAHFEVAFPLIAAGAPITIVQPGLVYGPGDHSPVARMLRRHLRGDLKAIPRDSAFCWAHVDDIARGHLLAAERGRPGEAYHLAGEAASVRDVLERIERWTGVPVPKHEAPPGLLRLLAAFFAPLEGIFHFPEDLHPETLRASAGVTYLGSSDKAKRELGFDPRPIDEGLRPVVEAELREIRSGD